MGAQVSSRRVQTWVWWLLPLLVARALMPAGFMAQAHEGGLQVVFCTAGVSQQSADGHDGTQPDVSQTDFSCPFAQAAAAPLLDLDGSEAIALLPAEKMLPHDDLPQHAAGPPRQDRARGPPAIS